MHTTSSPAAAPDAAHAPELLRKVDIARRLGISPQAVAQHIAAMGLQPVKGRLYDLAQYQRSTARSDVSKTIEEAKRDDLIAATRLKEIRIAEAEGRLISREIAIDLLSSLAQAYLSSIDNVLETREDQETAKAQLRADYAAILKRLPRLLTLAESRHAAEN